MNYVLEVNNLTKTYGKKQILNQVQFQIYEGCITGFIGINGAGKTTTIKSLLGLIKPEQGEIKIFGMDLKEHEKEIKERIGVVFDNGYLYDDLSILDMKRILASAYKDWDEGKFQNFMERFSLNTKEKIRNLSKGMRMKCALAYALSHHADLLIMDEPTSGLDPRVRKQLLDILKEFVEEEGKSVFFSTHITNDLDKVADEIVMIHEGKILFQEEKDSLLDKHALVKGDKKWLDQNTRGFFLNLEEKGFHFEGITDHRKQIRELMPEAVIEKPNMEDIMLAYSNLSV